MPIDCNALMAEIEEKLNLAWQCLYKAKVCSEEEHMIEQIDQIMKQIEELRRCKI